MELQRKTLAFTAMQYRYSLIQSLQAEKRTFACPFKLCVVIRTCHGDVRVIVSMIVIWYGTGNGLYSR